MNNFFKDLGSALFVSVFCLFGFLLFSPSKAEAQSLVIPEVISTNIGSYNVEVYIPAGATGPLPTVVFIPGNGEVGTDRTKLYTNGPLNFIKNSGWRPNFIVIGVQPSSTWPGNGFTHTVLNSLISNAAYPIDEDRLYVTGLSAGAAAIDTYIKTQANPVGIAAVVPMSITIDASCGNYFTATDYLCGNDLKWGNLASWGFAGSSDSHFAKMKRFFQLLINAGYDSRWTTYSGGHSGWNTYYNPTYTENINGSSMSIYDWMLQYSLGSTPPPPGNTPPTVNAGTDKNITLPLSFVTLSGSGSDTDGLITLYAWTKVSGGTATFSSTSSAIINVTDLAQGSYTFRLTVTDNGGATASDDVIVVVNADTSVNTAPTANAGVDQNITLPTSSVTLSGTATDPEGNAMTYAWTKVSGGTATIISPTSLNTQVQNLTQGTYTFWFTVTDSFGLTNADQVVVVVGAEGTSSGGGRTFLIDFGSPTATSSSGWNNVTSTSTGTVLNLISNTGASSTLSLIVTNGFNSTSSSGTTASSLSYPSSATSDAFFIGSFGGINDTSAQIQISGLTNTIPYSFTFYASRIVSDTSRNMNYSIGGQTVSLDAVNNVNNTVNISNVYPSNGIVTIDMTHSGAYGYLGVLQITESGSTPPPSNTPPTSNAGADQTITLPSNSVTLSGSGTDTGGSIASYAWTKISTLAATITTPSSASTTITGLAQGTHTFRLTVTDNGGATASDDVFVVVNPLVGSTACTSKKVVILGSSTAAGTGAVPTSNGWAWLYKTYYEGLAVGNTVDNLGFSGYTTYNILPTGTPVPAGFTIGTGSNITAAISRNPCAIIINMPSNDEANNLSITTQQANWEIIATAAQNANIPIWVTTTQPREWPLTNQGRLNLMTMRDWLTTRFGANSIDFWTTVANADGTVNPIYNSDGVHVNNLGHDLFYNRVRLESIPGASSPSNTPPTSNAGADQTITLPSNSVTLSGSGTDTGGSIASYAWTKISTLAATITTPSSASTTITGLAQGTHTFRLTVTDNGGATASDDVVVIVNSISGCKSVSSTGIIPSGGTDFWFMGNFNTTFNLNPCDTVILQAGTYGRIDIGIADGITFTNNGQVTINSVNFYPGSKNVKLLGNGTPGIQYGIKINGANSFATYWKATGELEIAHIEVVGTAAGIEVKHPPGEAYTQNFANVKIHDNYIHDHRLEGMYIGMDNLSLDVLINAEIYNNIVRNSGNDGIQTRNGTFNIHDNIVDNVALTPAFPYDINGILVGGNTKDSIIKNNTVSRVPGTAIFNNGWGNHTISCNVISSDQPGIFTKNYEFVAEDLQGVGFQNFTIQNNTITSTSGIALQTYYNNNGSTTVTNFSNNKTSGRLDASYTVVQSNNNSSVVPNCSSTPPPPSNIPPNANAGADQNITLPSNSVTLIGLGTDSDGSVASYSWTKLSGTGGSITSSLSASTTVTGLSQGVYTFRLTVTDNGGATTSDDVVIIVNAPGFTLSAGIDQSITMPTSSVLLSGIVSGGATASTYAWTKMSGPSATISSSSSISTSITGLTQGVYDFQLTVTDILGRILSDTVRVTVNGSNLITNNPPIVNAGADKIITGTTVQLSGLASDPDGNSLTYLWTQVFGANASNISSRNTLGTSVSNLSVGTYTFSLSVTDTLNTTSTDLVNITVQSPNIIGGAGGGGGGGSTTSPITTGANNSTNTTFPLFVSMSNAAPVINIPSVGVRVTSTPIEKQNLQMFLNWILGTKITPLVVDGKWGQKTTNAIKLFQTLNGLKPDGTFGKLSAAKAISLLGSQTTVVTTSNSSINIPSVGVRVTSTPIEKQNLQMFLNWILGTKITPLVVDGKWGQKTTNAIKLFQTLNGLKPDGTFGKLSAAKAISLLGGGY